MASSYAVGHAGTSFFGLGACALARSCAGPDALSGAAVTAECITHARLRLVPGTGDHSLLPAPQSCRLPLPPKTKAGPVSGAQPCVVILMSVVITFSLKLTAAEKTLYPTLVIAIL